MEAKREEGRDGRISGGTEKEQQLQLLVDDFLNV